MGRFISKIFGVLIFIGIMMLLSCSNNSLKVGFLLPNLSDARYLKDKTYFSEEIKKSGGDVEIGNASNDPNLQLKQAAEMIGMGVKVLVVAAVNQNLAASIVRLAHDHGVKVIAYERIIQNCDLDYIITFDHNEVGKLQATYAIQHKPFGNYVIIGGDKTDKNAELIKEGQMEVLKPLVHSGKIKLLYDIFVENWSKDEACEAINQVVNLSGQQIDVVLAANDEIAGGVRASLDKNGVRYSTLITGLDADSVACSRINKGQQSMTVFKPFKTEACLAAQLAVKLIHNDRVEYEKKVFNGLNDVPVFYLKPVVVDAVNIKSTLKAE